MAIAARNGAVQSKEWCGAKRNSPFRLRSVPVQICCNSIKPYGMMPRVQKEGVCAWGLRERNFKHWGAAGSPNKVAPADLILQKIFPSLTESFHSVRGLTI
jgi:hypothetical protein